MIIDGGGNFHSPPKLEDLDKLNGTKKKKKTINQKKKGKTGESYFANILSDISGHHFHRIYTSGASVGKSNSDKLDILTQGQAEAQLGDIQSPETLKYYLIWESKNYGELDFHNLLVQKGSTKIHGWIEELEYDIESALFRMKNNTRETFGFLCVKITRKGSWVVGNIKAVGTCSLPTPTLTFCHKTRDKLKEKGYGDEYFMCEFEEFFKYNKERFLVEDTDLIKKQKKAKEAYEKIMAEG